MELATGIYALSQTVDRNGTERTFHPAAVTTPKGVVLVDAGDPGTLEQIEANLESEGLSLDDVRAVVMTHQDGDHAGALRAMVDRTGAVVYAHGRSAPYLDGREHPIKSPPGQRYDPVDVDVELVDGVAFRTDAGPMEVVYTPGHAPGHISLYVPDEQTLLAADALTADEDGLTGPNEEYTPEMDRALGSAERLAELDVEQVLCYHGGAVNADGARIREIVASRQ